MRLEDLSRDVRLGDRIDRADLSAWIRERRSLPFRDLPGMEEEPWCRYHLAEVERLAARDESVVLFAPEAPCLAVARPLEWDSEILGLSLASLDYLLYPAGAAADRVERALEAMHHPMRRRGWHLLIHKTSPSDVAGLAILGPLRYDLLTIHVDYLFHLRTVGSGETGLEGYTFGEARPDEAAQLGELSARNHFARTRFRVDDRLPQDRVTELYAEWARNAVRGYADLVWLARRDGRPVGFTTWKIRRRLEESTGIGCAECQLAAVDASERGRGLFGRIAAGAFRRLRACGEQWASAATHILNTSGHRAFQGSGGMIYQSVITYRKDLERE